MKTTKPTHPYGTCKTCSYPLRPIFTSLACDQCDGIVKPPTFERGWVLWDTLTASAQRLLVFRSFEDAYAFQSEQHHLSPEQKQIKPVQLDQPVSWYCGSLSSPFGRQYMVSNTYIWVLPTRFDSRPNGFPTAFITY